MKKLIFLGMFVCAFASFTSLGQVTIAHDTVSKQWTKDGYVYNLKDSITNNTASPINITWSKSNEVLLSGWSYIGICDKMQCYNAPVSGNKAFTIDPGEKVLMYVDAKATAVAVDGYNYITLKVNDGISDQYITYEMYTIPSKLTNIENNNIVSIYPNPANDFINLSINDAKVTGINVLNIIGKKVAHFDITPNTPNPMRIPLDNIAKGIYLLQFADVNGKLMGVKRVTKQ